ncbi:unnamed protein product [Amoebophrya sp. A120]|nr:unnamed protein product [Amoebophrya sp. A120]|eukprot:GSA120T00018119001.1
MIIILSTCFGSKNSVLEKTCYSVTFLSLSDAYF